MPVAFQATPILNADPTLNALTQLGALRLNCDRAFVSLIDRQYQYVITEVTRSHSFQKIHCAPGDTVAIGVCKLNNCDGVCPATMKAFMDETGEWVKTGPDVISNRTRYIINDFTTHPDYKDRPYVVAYPFFRSYLEVPLVSPLGYLLGSYCVVDSHKNDFDNDDIVEVMNEIASAIMAHLENVRIRQSRDRSEQLIEGLSGFIRHEPPAQHPNTRSETTRTHRDRTSSVVEQTPDVVDSVGSAGPHGNDESDTHSVGTSGRPSAPNMVSSSSIETAQSTRSARSISSPRLDEDESETPPTTPRDDSEVNPMEQQLITAITNANANANASIATSQPSVLPSDAPGPPNNGFIGSANIKRTFFRAAATIRRSMNMDGLMFLDAVPSSYADRSDQPALDKPSRNETEGPYCVSIVKSAVGPEGETITNSCPTRLPEISLQRFIRAYPQGHVFTADEFGPIDDSYGMGKPFESHPKADQENLRLRKDIAALFHVLPSAKYVIFLPLWHFQRECWFAATLGWVEDPTRAIEVADVGLVSAFGNSVMAEVSRLEALAADRAKSDFVSSISHELRSPLHGIMASSELLRENISNSVLLPTLDMLDSCATTLLDTFNNLLDHAIVTHSGRDRGSSATISELKVADLGELVEDVVEAVRVGHLSGNAIQMQSAMQKKREHVTQGSDTANGLPDRPLLVTISIARREDWKLPLNIGAWKRIVMNVFGNALKYTVTGRIDVGLKVVQRKVKAGNSSEYILLTVADTGLGMSSDYLKYHLFTPFSQENSHSPGMGLGLSIVQQLVSDLGGIVDVKSSVAVGTLVEVLVPLGKDASDPPPGIQPAIGDKQRLFDEHRSELAGRTVCLITPDAYVAMTDTGLQVTKKMRDWSTFIERAIKVNAAEALGMKVVLGTKDCPTPDADIYIMDGSILNHTPKKDPSTLLPARYSRATPLVLLCSGSGPPSCFKKEAAKRHPIHLHHPIGPRKLASVFCSVLKGELKELKYIDVQSQSPAQSSGIVSSWIGPVPMPAVADGSDIKREPLSPDIKRKPPPPLSLPSRPRIGPTVSQPPHTPSALVEKEEKKSASEPTLTVSQPPPTKKCHHLLLVDDNPINIKLLVHVVSKLNHTFVTAANGLEAVQLYKKSLEGEHEQRFDLVFMDISMPVMNGFEATRTIRQLEIDVGVERCRVVALTGLSSEVNRIEATASGCDLFLTKPVKMNTVRGLLDEMGKKEEEGKRKEEISETKGEDRREEGQNEGVGKDEDEGNKGKEGETRDGVTPAGTASSPQWCLSRSRWKRY